MSDNNFLIKKTHPCLEGHFPGNPIVPGVVILDEITSLVRLENRDSKIIGFSNVKFLKPISAEQLIEIAFNTKKENKESIFSLKFTAYYMNNAVAQGIIKLEKRE